MARLENGCTGTPRVSIHFQRIPGSTPFTFIRTLTLSFEYESPYGAIHSEWKVVENQATWKVTVPPNATALLSPRATNAMSISFKGVSVENSELHTDPSGRVELQAGSYTFTATVREPASGSGGTLH